MSIYYNSTPVQRSLDASGGAAGPRSPGGGPTAHAHVVQVMAAL
jgi:hypothetical protein